MTSIRIGIFGGRYEGWRNSFWSYAEDVTTDFVYMRLHCTGTLYSSEYPDTALNQWASRTQEWPKVVSHMMHNVLLQ